MSGKEIRIILTSEGQDPSEFKINLPNPLALDADWRVAISELSIPDKIVLLNEEKDKVRITRDARIPVSRRHRQIVQNFDDLWSSSHYTHSLITLLSQHKLKKNDLFAPPVKTDDAPPSPETPPSNPQPEETVPPIYPAVVTAGNRPAVVTGDTYVKIDDAPPSPVSRTPPSNPQPEGTAPDQPADTRPSSEHRTCRTFDMSLNYDVHCQPYKMMAAQLSSALKKGGGASRYYFDEVSRKGIFIVADNEWISLAGELPHIMSMPNLLLPGRLYMSQYCVDIFQNQRTTYIYSDLGREVVMGEGVYHFLQAFSIKDSRKRGDISSYVEFRKPIFIPLQKSHITSIHITLRNESGEKLKFAGGTPLTTCKLIFKRFGPERKV